MPNPQGIKENTPPDPFFHPFSSKSLAHQTPKTDTVMKAALVLEDGTVLQGKSFGAETNTTGEVVFNTGMTGYTEALTDPSYAGQILVQTYPLIGNYGVPYGAVDRFGLPAKMESNHIHVQGYVVAEYMDQPSHWASTISLDNWLKKEGIPGIYGIDTRQLTKKLRSHGVMLGRIVTGDLDKQELKHSAGEIPDPNLEHLVAKVSGTHKHYVGYGSKITVIDCGVKYGIIRELLKRGADVTTLPYDASIENVLEQNPDGVLVSNGPGDPAVCTETINTLEALMETTIPIFGICLGHQLLALASGAEKYKLKYGHRGQNHPCTCLDSNRSYVTSQNHGYGIEPESLQGTGFKPLFVNTNDGTLEGIKHMEKPVFAVQFHPEGQPGPLDTTYLFDEFMKEMRR